MKDIIFVDTGFLIAIINKDDKYHPEAIRTYQKIKELARKRLVELIYTDYIFDEVMAFLVSRSVTHSTIVEYGNNLRKSQLFQFIFISETMYDESWKMFKKYQDKQWSFTDVTSFYVMETFGITYYLSYDEHFEQFTGTVQWNPN